MLKKLRELFPSAADKAYAKGEQLVYAALHGDETLVKKLLDEGADPAHGNHEPLQQAAFNANAGVVKILLDRGASLTAENFLAYRKTWERYHRVNMENASPGFSALLATTLDTMEQFARDNKIALPKLREEHFPRNSNPGYVFRR